MICVSALKQILATNANKQGYKTPKHSTMNKGLQTRPKKTFENDHVFAILPMKTGSSSSSCKDKIVLSLFAILLSMLITCRRTFGYCVGHDDDDEDEDGDDDDEDDGDDEEDEDDEDDDYGGICEHVQAGTSFCA